MAGLANPLTSRRFPTPQPRKRKPLRLSATSPGLVKHLALEMSPAARKDGRAAQILASRQTHMRESAARPHGFLVIPPARKQNGQHFAMPHGLVRRLSEQRHLHL